MGVNLTNSPPILVMLFEGVQNSEFDMGE